jgi:general secretion pathway protein F
MIFIALGVVVYLFVSVVPKLQKVFSSLRVELPPFTKMLIAISEGLQAYWWAFSVVVLLGYLLFRRWAATEKGRSSLDAWLLTLPVFGPVILRLNVSKFTKTLATLLASGVPIIRALEITSNIVGNKILSDVIVTSKTAVQEGNSLGQTIERSGVFPPLVSHMIKTGEKTGELEKMLVHLADAYDQEVERKINTMISLIEPLMIVVLGGIVVVVVAGMMVPMLSVMNQVR